MAAARIATIPNLITLVRLGCIPLFLWLLLDRNDPLGAAYLLGGLGATDSLDGFVARRFNQVSEFGKILDPVADRILFIVCAGAMIVDNAVPRWFASIIVAREMLLGGTLALLTAFGMKRFDVTWWGKLATFALMFTFPLFLVHAAGVSFWSTFCWWAAWIIGLPGLIISLVTAVAYIPTMMVALRTGRAERLAAGAPATAGRTTD